MEPQKWRFGLDDFPFQLLAFLGAILIFKGVIIRMPINEPLTEWILLAEVQCEAHTLRCIFDLFQVCCFKSLAKHGVFHLDLADQGSTYLGKI